MKGYEIVVPEKSLSKMILDVVMDVGSRIGIKLLHTYLREHDVPEVSILQLVALQSEIPQHVIWKMYNEVFLYPEPFFENKEPPAEIRHLFPQP